MSRAPRDGSKAAKCSSISAKTTDSSSAGQAMVFCGLPNRPQNLNPLTGAAFRKIIARMPATLRTRAVFVLFVFLGAVLFLAEAQDNAGKGGGKGKSKGGPPGANHPERLQALIITGQN